MSKIIPREILYLMASEQVCQGNPKNIELFLENPKANIKQGGFSWSSSILGYNFWVDVIVFERYDIGITAYNHAREINFYNKEIKPHIDKIYVYLDDYGKINFRYK